MAFLSTLLATAAGSIIKEPTWMWEKLLLHVFDFIANYGWRVVVFTVCLKLILSPLDIYQRIMMRKNQRIAERLKPQIEKLKKQYPDQQQFMQAQSKLQKKEGYSYFSSCLPAIVTMAVMFSLLGALNEVSRYMNFRDYYEMYDVYNRAERVYNGFDVTPAEGEDYDAVYKAAVDELIADGIIDESRLDADGRVIAYADDPEAVEALKEQGVIADGRTYTARDGTVIEADYSTQFAQECVRNFYEENKTSFLWIKNIWSPDVPWKKEVNQYNQFIANIGKKRAQNGDRSGISDESLSTALAKYETVMGSLLSEEHNGANGYLVLPILCVLLSVATQLISRHQQKTMGQDQGAMGGGTMKMMMFLMPVMIGWFSLSYTAAFSLYLIISYAFSLLINGVSAFIVWSVDHREKVKLATEVHKYGRPDPNDLKAGAEAAKPGEKEKTGGKKRKSGGDKGKSEGEVIYKYGRPDPNDRKDD